MSSTPPRVAAPAGIRAWVRPLSGLLLLLLAAQFAIGMVVNLWVALPASHPGANAANYFAGVVRGDVWALFTPDWSLQLHVLFGILLLAAAVLLLAAAILRREALWIWLTSVGLLGIIGAGFNGASFLDYGHDFSSMLMSAGFVVALCSYTAGLYFTRPDVL